MKRTLVLFVIAALIASAFAMGVAALRPSEARATTVTAGVAPFADVDFGGEATLITTSQPDLSQVGDNWANRISSLKVLGGIVIAAYSEPNYQGACEPFVGQDPNLTNNPIGNDTIRSIKLFATCSQDPVGDPVITAMTAVAGASPQTYCPADYVQKNQDLNEGVGGDYIYLCLEIGQSSGSNWVQRLEIVTSLTAESSDGTCVDANSGGDAHFVAVDLNQGAGGSYVYLCYWTADQAPPNNAVDTATGTFRDIGFANTGSNLFPSDDEVLSDCGNEFPTVPPIGTVEIQRVLGPGGLNLNDSAGSTLLGIPAIWMCALTYPQPLSSPPDTTPPTITLASRTPPANAAGWNNADVTLTWSCADSQSGPIAATVSQTVSAEGANQAATGTCADRAGNTASDTQTGINIDKTAPTTAASATTADGGAYRAGGWSRQRVTITLGAQDQLSGVAATYYAVDQPTCAPTSLGGCTAYHGAFSLGEGHHTVTFFSVDNAGNAEAAQSLPVWIDLTPPTTPAAIITSGGVKLVGDIEWFKDWVTITYEQSSDPNLGDGSSGSGVARYSPAQTFTTSGRFPFSGTATDTAGNVSAPSTGTVYVDATPPTVACDAPDPAWHATDVTIHCTASDGESGLADPADANFTLTTRVPAGTETSTASTASHQVCDAVGHCVTAGPITGIRVDKKPPTIDITAPASATPYLLHQAVAVGYACADGGSGVATCVGPVANGGALDTTSVGAKTFAVSATDQAGNAASRSVPYTVSYNICPLYDQTKAVQSGATIPIKLQLCDAQGANASASSIVVTAMTITGPDGTPLLPTAAGGADPGNAFRYDPTLGGTGGYIYHLSTTGLATGTYTLSFTVAGDPVTHTVQFQVR